jgi:hypothetical protein
MLVLIIILLIIYPSPKELSFCIYNIAELVIFFIPAMSVL